VAQEVKVDGKYYPSCAAACQDFGIPIEGDSAHRRLERWRKSNPGHTIEYIGIHQPGTQPFISPQQTSRHEELKQKMLDIGNRLGYKTSAEETCVGYRHDVLWKPGPFKQDPSHVIEICAGGSLPKDFDALSVASKELGTKGILVILDDIDYHKALRRFENQPEIVVVKAEIVDRLSELVVTDLEFFKLIFNG
jgi:hypothetical protein